MSAEVRHPSNFEQPPSHFMRIGFENWGDFQRTNREQERESEKDRERARKTERYNKR